MKDAIIITISDANFIIVVFKKKKIGINANWFVFSEFFTKIWCNFKTGNFINLITIVLAVTICWNPKF